MKFKILAYITESGELSFWHNLLSYELIIRMVDILDGKLFSLEGISQTYPDYQLVQLEGY